MMSPIFVLLALLSPHQAPSKPLEWTLVGKNKHESISGLARLAGSWEAPRFAMVLDNKKPKQPHICWLYNKGGWKMDELKISDPKKLASDVTGATEIKDLEGVCNIPGKPFEILAIGNKGDAEGWLYRFKLDGEQAILEDAFVVPDVLPDSDFEAIDLHKSGNRLVAVWADRGTPTRPALVSAATIDFGKRPNSPFGPVAKLSVKTPWPTREEARSVADLRVDASGNIYVSSVSDPGDSGPFDSAIYIVAKLTEKGGTPALIANAPKMVVKAPGHKIEAIELSGKGFVFGTDDEDQGGSISWFTPSLKATR